MKAIISAILASLMLAACNPMPNDKIIEATKKCAEAGLGVTVHRYESVGAIYEVQCDPSKRPADKGGNQ